MDVYEILILIYKIFDYLVFSLNNLNLSSFLFIFILALILLKFSWLRIFFYLFDRLFKSLIIKNFTKKLNQFIGFEYVKLFWKKKIYTYKNDKIEKEKSYLLSRIKELNKRKVKKYKKVLHLNGTMTQMNLQMSLPIMDQLYSYQ